MSRDKSSPEDSCHPQGVSQIVRQGGERLEQRFSIRIPAGTYQEKSRAHRDRDSNTPQD